jgi:C1A family cysteine protease
MIRTVEGYGLGWLPDHPDFRDYTTGTTCAPSRAGGTVPELLRAVGVAEPDAALPPTVDLRDGFSPVENQGRLGSCTANAGAGLLEYFQRTAFGSHVDASRLFLYKATRNLMGVTGDTGAFLRTTMQAMVLFGVPPEEIWPYDDGGDAYDVEPSAFCYAFGTAYQAIQYYRLDPAGTAPGDVLARIKANLAARLPAMFGFTVFSSYTRADDAGGAFPFPKPGEKRIGGHAMVVAGYDDSKQIEHAPNPGALLVRNSWGAEWGDDGYGWLPYDYVSRGLATDWWSLIQAEWVDAAVFGPEDG